MADSTRKTNKVIVVGYLKENGLRLITGKDGGKVICGNIIISTSDISSYKIQSFYVKELDYSNNPNPMFATLSNFVAENLQVVSIASFLKANPGADFEQAKAAATQLWVLGEYEEYTLKDGDNIVSTPTIKGKKVGFQSDSVKEFVPHATYEFTTYVKEISEKDENGNIVITGLVDGYDKNSRATYPMNQISLLCEAKHDDVAVADYVLEHYKVGDTIHFRGDISTVQTKTVKEAVTDGFGTVNTPEQVITKISHDYIVTGGKIAPDTLVYTKEQVKAGLVVRDSKALENTDRKANRASFASSASTAPAVTTPKVSTNNSSSAFSSSMFDDMDF